jgi:DNA polymerase-1
VTRSKKIVVGESAEAVLPDAGAEGVFYVVDVSGYVFRAYHALPPLSNSRGEPTHAVLGTITMLEKVIENRRPAWFAIALDAPGPTFREALDVRYKATRPPAPPDLSRQMARVEQILRAWGVACFRRDGLEADDLIAAATSRALGSGWRVVIVSADKDLLQLVDDDDDRVLVWDSMRDRVYGPREVFAKFGVWPSRVRDWLALTGDTSDNVPGVAGVGPKTATDLLTKFGSFDGIYGALDQIDKPKLRDSLSIHSAEASLSRTLVTLDGSAPIEWNESRLRWTGLHGDLSELRRLYAELDLRRQLAALDAIATPNATATTTPTPTPTPAPTTTSPVPTPTPQCIFDEIALGALVARARARGRIGVAVERTHAARIGAQIVGIALAIQSDDVAYVPISHRVLDCPPLLPWQRAKLLLDPLLSDPSVTKFGHDLKEAELAVSQAGSTIAAPVFDTLLAAYLLDPEGRHSLADLAQRELGVVVKGLDDRRGKRAAGPDPDLEDLGVDQASAIAAMDAALPLSIGERLEPRMASEGLMSLFRDVEMPLVRVLAKMELRGVLVDVGALEQLGRRAEQQLALLEDDCKRLAGHDFSVRSRDQVEALLFDELKLPIVKRTPKGGRSTDAEVLEVLEAEHPIAERLLQFREMDKLKGTYLDALPRFVNPATGRIHTRFDQAAAATGRLSSNEPNLQNIPVRTEFGRLIRGAFVAPPGHVILSADYSQIELRVLAHLAQDPELLEAFRSGGDVHARTAALVFGKPQADVTPDERRAAKTINFGVLYGMGDSALAKQLRITRAEAARFIAAYFERYAGVARFMNRTVQAARQGEAVRSLLGRRRFLPNLGSSNRGLRAEAERVARNTPIQGTAADILKLAMVALGGDDERMGARLVLTVHDELVFEVPEESAVKAGEWIRERMAGAIELDVPLVVDVGFGKSWAQAH